MLLNTRGHKDQCITNLALPEIFQKRLDLRYTTTGIYQSALPYTKSHTFLSSTRPQLQWMQT